MSLERASTGHMACSRDPGVSCGACASLASEFVAVCLQAAGCVYCPQAAAELSTVLQSAGEELGWPAYSGRQRWHAGGLINWQAPHARNALQCVLTMEPDVSATGAGDPQRFGATEAAWAAIRAAALTASPVTLRPRPYSLNTELGWHAPTDARGAKAVSHSPRAADHTCCHCPVFLQPGASDELV